MPSDPPECREVRPEEYAQVLEVWSSVWGDGEVPYFRAYLEGDPWFRDRYCRVARVEGRIVSVAMVCRRPIRAGTRTLTMGGIANVATRPEYRRCGYSGELVRQCAEVMEAEDFDFSALGTGIHRHYARHGWFQVTTPHHGLTLRADAELPPADPDIAPMTVEAWLAEAPPVYAAFNTGLALCFERSMEYWNGWIRIRSEGWDAARTVILGLWEDGVLEGYLLGSLPEEPGGAFEVHEIAAVRGEGLPRLLTQGIRLARSAGAKELSVRAPRQEAVEAALSRWGELRIRADDSTMLRRVHADELLMGEITRSYEMGHTAWWLPDDF